MVLEKVKDLFKVFKLREDVSQGVQTRGGCQSRCSERWMVQVSLVLRQMKGLSLYDVESYERAKSL